MKITITVRKSEGKNTAGEFPIIFSLDKTVNGTRKKKRIRSPFYSSLKNWDLVKCEPKKAHPKFNVIYPYVLEKKLEIDKIYRNGTLDFDTIEIALAKKFDPIEMDVIKYGYKLSDKKLTTTREMYTTALNELKKVFPVLPHQQFTYKNLIKFKEELNKKELKNSTIHTYLSKLRSIYNEFCRVNNLENNKPFENVFSGLNSRSFTDKRNYLTKKQIRRLRSANLGGLKMIARDFALLQFYLGGQDLKDIIYLKKKDFHKKRIYFNRSKLNSGYELSNRVFPEAIEIVNRYKCEDLKNEFLFPFRTDEKGYKTFRRRIQKNLVLVQKQLKIELPNYGNIGIKTFRHTFANFGKLLFVHEDILREIQGHERKDIDNYYKDHYPEKIRDKFHRKIIDKVIPKGDRILPQ